MRQTSFSVPFENTHLIGDTFGEGAASILCLHGAGMSDRSRYASLRQTLADRGHSSCAFDFLGHGETGGDITSSSLEKRTRQAEAVISAQKLQMPLTIIAGSMAGYNAIKLTEILSVESMILFVPAVYRSDAYAVHFGEQFSKLIREPQSWNETDAWEILGKYTGKLLIIVGDKDEVVPFELTQKIYDSASNASSREIIVEQNASHAVMKYLEEHPDEFARITEKVVESLT